MIKINLLPYREREKGENLKRQIIIISATFVVFLLIIVFLQLHTARSIGKLEREVKSAEGQLRVLTKITGDFEKFKKDKVILKKKLAIIENLENNRLAPVLFLDDLTTRIPRGSVWLTALSGSDTVFRIEGVAKNNTAIANFMKSLEKSQYVESVDLILSRQTIISDTKLKKFIISCARKMG